MAGIRRVVGIEPDGSVVTATFGRHQIRILSASYADGVDPADLMEMGTQTIAALTPGTYKRDDLKIKMRSTRFRADFLPLMPKNGGGNIIIPVVIGFTHPDIGSDSDLLAGARCTNWSAAMENSNKALEIELTWKFRQIYWTSARKTVNALNGATPVGASSF